jgi:hypothetical protein
MVFPNQAVTGDHQFDFNRGEAQEMKEDHLP